jgi:hypothetical protein
VSVRWDGACFITIRMQAAIAPKQIIADPIARIIRMGRPPQVNEGMRPIGDMPREHEVTPVEEVDPGSV